MKVKVVVSKGDYVLAARWLDADPHDPWAVGFVNDIETSLNTSPITRYYVGNEGRGYRHCMKIPHNVGDWLLRNRELFESAPAGVINLFAMLSGEYMLDLEGE